MRTRMIPSSGRKRSRSSFKLVGLREEPAQPEKRPALAGHGSRVPRHRLSTSKRNALACLTIQQLVADFAACFFSFHSCRAALSFFRTPPSHLFLHRDDVGDSLRALTTHGGPPECIQSNLSIGLELHDRHLQQFRAVLEAVLRCGLRRQLVREIVRQTQQVLQSVVVFVIRQPAK